MPNPPAVTDLGTADYEVIESAVMETARGRWFLSEYARRNRHADTQVLLAAIARLEQTVADQRASSGIDRFKVDLVEMSSSIAHTRAEIRSLNGAASEAASPVDLASMELDAVVQATEQATTEILGATEAIQDAAWSLREKNVDVTLCDALDEQATNIYTACSFQDLTAQRTRKVIEVLRFLETRINAMIEIWGFGGDSRDRPGTTTPAPAPADDATIDEHLTQTDIDFVLVEVPRPGSPGAVPDIGIADENFGFADDAGATPSPQSPPASIVRDGNAKSRDARGSGKTLDDLDRLSIAEKSRLFV